MSILTTALIQDMENSDMPQVMIDGLKNSMGQIEDTMVRFRREDSRLKGHKDYTSTGKKTRTMEAAQQAAAELDKIKSNSSGYYGLTEQLQETLKPDTRPDDSTLAFLQEQEIRSRLSDLDPLELQVRYMDACSGDGVNADLVAMAIESDPMPRLDEDILTEGRQIRGKRKDPAAARKLQHITRLKAGLEDALKEAMNELHSAGLPEDDWLTMVATGKIDPENKD